MSSFHTCAFHVGNGLSFVANACVTEDRCKCVNWRVPAANSCATALPRARGELCPGQFVSDAKVLQRGPAAHGIQRLLEQRPDKGAMNLLANFERHHSCHLASSVPFMARSVHKKSWLAGALAFLAKTTVPPCSMPLLATLAQVFQTSNSNTRATLPPDAPS